MLKKFPLLLIFIATILALVIAFKQTAQAPAPLTTEDATDTRPSWQAFNMTSWHLSNAPENPTQTRIHADQITYQNTERLSHFKAPFVIRDEPQQRMTLESDSGFSENDTRVTLEKNIVIHRFDKANPNEISTLNTEKITYNSETGLLYSPLFTQITQPNTIISGVGFEADLTTDTYRFLSQVKTQFQPNQD